MFPEGEHVGLLMGVVGGMRNHEDSSRKSQSVQDGMKRVAERGKFIGGRRPYGYDKRVWLDAANRRQFELVHHPVEAAVVRRIFAEYISGRSQSAIARDLHFEKVPTLVQTMIASEGHKPTKRASENSTWHATTIAGILQNPTYLGMVTMNGEHYQAPHEPIIDQGTWAKACQLRTGRGGRPRGRRTNGKHLLTEGLLRCTCGAAMSPVTRRETRVGRADVGKLYEVYMCVEKLHHGKEACATRQSAIKRELIDTNVLRYFQTVALDVDATRRSVAEGATRRLEQHRAQRARAEHDVAKAESRLAKIKRGWQDDVLTDDEYMEQREDLNAEREAALAELERLSDQQRAVEDEIAAFDTDAVVTEELARIGQLVLGEIEEGSREGIESFRATLKRLFVGFELTSPVKPFGAGVLQGQVWSEATPRGQEPDNPMMSLGEGYALLPVVRRDMIDSDGSHAEGFPAVRRAALSLRDNFAARLPA
jgi:hypothetical protein